MNIPVKLTGQEEVRELAPTRATGSKRRAAVKKPLSNRLLVKPGQQSIRWALIEDEQQEEIRKLRTSVTNGTQKYGFSTPWGFFVSATQFSQWSDWVERTDTEAQKFWEHAVEGLLKREAESVRIFKHDFSIRFPQASASQVNAAARLIKDRLLEIKKIYKHERIFRPKWGRADIAPSSRAGFALNEPLSRSIEAMSDEIWTHDLADFVRGATGQARSAAPGLKLGSSKKTCEEKLARVRERNFYGDAALEGWCRKLEVTAKLLPGLKTRLSAEKANERRGQAAKNISQLMEEAHQMLLESESWRFLAPGKTLAKFVSALSPSQRD